MNDTTITFLVVVFCAVVFGPLTARSSNRREAIYGGVASQVLHLAACMSFVGMIPGVLAALITGAGFELAFPLALGLFALSVVILLAFALVEQEPRRIALEKEQAQGWTEEDARTSGL